MGLTVIVLQVQTQNALEWEKTKHATSHAVFEVTKSEELMSALELQPVP